MRVGMGQISLATGAALDKSNRATCEAQGNVWVLDPNPLLSPEQIAAGAQPGMCIPGDVARSPGFDPSTIQFEHMQCGGNTSMNAALPVALATPPPSLVVAVAPLPPEVINGPVPTIVTTPAPAVFVATMECPSFDVAIDSNKFFAAAGLLALFALLGGFK